MQVKLDIYPFHGEREPCASTRKVGKREADGGARHCKAELNKTNAKPRLRTAEATVGSLQ